MEFLEVFSTPIIRGHWNLFGRTALLSICRITFARTGMVRTAQAAAREEGPRHWSRRPGNGSRRMEEPPPQRSRSGICSLFDQIGDPEENASPLLGSAGKGYRYPLALVPANKEC